LKPAPHLRMRRYSSTLASAIIVLAAVASSPTHARAGEPQKEKPYALIFGTVWDPDGHPVYGVRVKIRRADQKRAHWELYSNHTGEFAQRVPAGKADYVVWADLKDYKLPSGKHLHAGPEVTVHIDNDERSDVGLHLNW
jgi:hypothetical protein